MPKKTEPEDKSSYSEAYRLMWGSEAPAAGSIEPVMVIGSASDVLVDTDLDPNAEVVVDLRPDVDFEMPDEILKPRPVEAAEVLPKQDAAGMMVPRQAWETMLDQLGNLHRSGDDLARALERATKAEVTVQFLSDRLADVTIERDHLKQLLSEFLAINDPSADGSGPEQYREGTMVDLMSDLLHGRVPPPEV